MNKEEQPQICTECGESMEKTETAFTVDYSSDVGVIRRVPALKCTHCGTEWIEGNSKRSRDKGVL